MLYLDIGIIAQLCFGQGAASYIPIQVQVAAQLARPATFSMVIARVLPGILFFSFASIWEIAIKRGYGRQDFLVKPRVLRRGLIDNAYHELVITSEHAVAIDSLPGIHKDAFFHLILAQAKVEGIILLTSDE